MRWLSVYKRFYFEHILGILLAAAIGFIGLVFMLGRDYKLQQAQMVQALSQAAAENAQAAALENMSGSVPVSGMNVIINEYVAFSEENAASYLSTTVFSDSADDEYVNEDGTSIGKYIVCTASSYANVYSEPYDTDEEGSEGEVIATIETYGIVSLISVSGDGWCHILSEGTYGYVREEDFAFGEDAKALDENTYFDVVTITQETYLYQLANSRSTVLCVLSEGLQFEVVSAGSNYIRIYVDGVGEGLVKTSLVTQETIRKYIVFPEETQAQEEAVEEGIAAADELGPSFIWPLPYPYYSNYITSTYGYRSVRIGSSYHRGIDIKASKGTSIYAVMDATVAETGYSSSQGYYIVLYHGNGLYTLYYHMCKATTLSEGEKVSQGDVIGYVGSTGNSSGSHLHFGVGVGGYTKEYLVDPASYLGV